MTNAGERRLPYVFRAEAGASVRALAGLKRPMDFARLAREDMDLACRLFDYQDFVTAPFMQGTRARAVYEGLKGGRGPGGGRGGVYGGHGHEAGGGDPREGGDPQVPGARGRLDDVLVIRKKNWGYVKLSVETEGEFLTAARERLTDRDFKNGEYALSFHIDPDRMHRGRNLGCITIRGIRGESRVYIVAEGHEQRSCRAWSDWPGARSSRSTLALRLDYACGRGAAEPLAQAMAGELLKLRSAAGSEPLTDLLTAEAVLMCGRRDQAAGILEECRGPVWERRSQDPELYCFYQYLVMETDAEAGAAGGSGPPAPQLYG